MYKISPILGPPLMLVFVTMTNILLLTSLISLLSNSLDKIIGHAREEYLFVYSSFVLEASTSNRLTYFYPPFNLLAITLIRPLRIIVPAERIRAAKIILLKATHFPFVLMIQAYEGAAYRLQGSPIDIATFPLGPDREGRNTIRENPADSVTTLGVGSDLVASRGTIESLGQPSKRQRAGNGEAKSVAPKKDADTPQSKVNPLKNIGSEEAEDLGLDEEIEHTSSDRETQDLLRELLTRVNKLSAMIEQKNDQSIKDN